MSRPKRQKCDFLIQDESNSGDFSSGSEDVYTPDNVNISDVSESGSPSSSSNHPSRIHSEKSAIPNNPKKSKFDTYFNIELKGTNRDKIAKCKVCVNSKEIKMTRGNTTGLKKHLRCKHSKKYFELFPEEQISTKPQAGASTSRLSIPEMFAVKSQLKISIFYPKVKRSLIMNCWDVIIWENEGAVDFVPSCWGNMDRSVYKYPKKSGLTDAKLRNLKNKCAPLEENFESLPAKCRLFNVTDMQKTYEYSRKYQDTSNIESDDDEDTHRKKRKRIIKPIKFGDYENNSSDDDCSKNNINKKTFHIPDEDYTKANNSYCFGVGSVSTKKMINIVSDQILSPSPPSQTSVVPTTKPVTDLGQFSKTLASTATKSTSVSDQFPQTSSGSVSNVDGNVVTRDFMNQVVKELADIKYEVKLLKENFNVLHNQAMAKQAIDSSSVDEYVELASLLPCKNIDDVKFLDSILHDETYKKLVNIFHLVGGNSVHKAIQLMMNKALIPNVSILYSCQGRSGKKLPFSDLKLYRAIFEATRKRFPNESDETIRKEVGLYLTTAPSRLPPSERKKKSNNKENQN